MDPIIEPTNLFGWIPALAGGVSGFFRGILPWFVGISAIASIAFIYGIVHAALGLQKLKEAEEKRHMKQQPLGPAAASAEKAVFREPEGNPRWQRILALADSANQNDWRAAILESDIILDQMLSKMGYKGKDLGEKLMGIERSDFDTLDQAWEAHKVRNRVAHMGSDYVMSQQEARRAIDLYAKVFKEFQYI